MSDALKQSGALYPKEVLAARVVANPHIAVTNFGTGPLARTWFELYTLGPGLWIFGATIPKVPGHPGFPYGIPITEPDYP